MAIRYLLRLVSICVLGCAPLVRSTELTTELLQEFSYKRGAPVHQWRPMTGSEPVSRTVVDSRVAYQMICNFRGTSMERASWDHTITHDLSMCQGLQFRFYCADPAAARQFVMYLHSEAGWYRGSFAAPTVGQWGLVQIHKQDMQVEGRPGGWGKIDTIRVSAWRGQDVDTQFYITELALFHQGTNIVVLSGDSVAQNAPGELQAVHEYTNVMSQFLDRAHLGHLVMSDLDVTAERLRDTALLILPHNPAMEDHIVQNITRFMQTGGRLLACYHLPEALAALAGIQRDGHLRQPHSGYFASIRPEGDPLKGMPPSTQQASWNIQQVSPVDGQARIAAWWYTNQGESTDKPAILVSDQCVYLTHVLLPDDAANKLKLLLSMAGTLVPDVWPEAARGVLDQIGRFGTYKGYDTAKQGIRALAPNNEDVRSTLETTDSLRSIGLTLIAEQKFPEATEVAAQAQNSLIEAFCQAQQPLRGEHRAFWCHSAFGVAGMTWDEAIRRLAESGFTAILPNMLWGGVAFYNSEVLPVSPTVQTRGDQITLCVDACKKHGIECHAWKVNFNMGWATDQAFVNRMKALNRVQVSFDGSLNERWLCPSHPDNQRLEVDAMVEVARKYEVDGIHFDYIRYPGQDNCFCTGCRERFEVTIGTAVPQWPTTVRADHALTEKWLVFRRDQITSVVAAVSTEARLVKPDIRISAAVFRNWPTDRDSVGQDWKLWCDRGYLDFVCPMDYLSSNIAFKHAVEQQRQWAGQVPCYPGIGLSVWESSHDVVKLIEQITITRGLDTRGFTVFNYGSQEAREVLFYLGKGITALPNGHEE
jgi:uncharacterized lipoprotein YddW (UPF0748 family)